MMVWWEEEEVEAGSMVVNQSLNTVFEDYLIHALKSVRWGRTLIEFTHRHFSLSWVLSVLVYKSLIGLFL